MKLDSYNVNTNDEGLKKKPTSKPESVDNGDPVVPQNPVLKNILPDFVNNYISEISDKLTKKVENLSMKGIERWYHNYDDLYKENYNNKARQWMKDWYDHPETQRRLKDMMVSKDAEQARESMIDSPYMNHYNNYLKDRIVKKEAEFYNTWDKGVQNLSDVAIVNSDRSQSDIDYFLKEHFNKGKSKKDASDLDSGVAGRYVWDDNVISVDRSLPDYQDGVDVHELTHSLRRFGLNIDGAINPMDSGFNSDIKYTNDKLSEVKENAYRRLKAKNLMGTNHEQYLLEDGFYPRVMEIRRSLNLKPGEEFTKDHIKKLQKADENLEYNKVSPYSDLSKFFLDSDIITIMNNIASNDKTPDAPTGMRLT